ncbi:transposable element Tc3 transposase [Trichonephila clavipes]|nr:transposable element Tc3 transposase [Trichonephila clavipes]
MARIVRHNDESVRKGYIRDGGKEVKLFTSALKAFQCNNRIDMHKGSIWMIFYVENYWTTGMWTYPAGSIPRNLESPRVSSPGFGNDSKMMVMFSLQSDSRRTLIWRAPGTRYHQENTIERHRYGGAGWLVWGGIILVSRTDLHVQSVTMTGHIDRDVILEQHTNAFNRRISPVWIGAYSPDLNPIKYVWNMIGRRIAAHQHLPTCLPEVRRALLDEWCNIPQDQIDNLILSRPRRCKACIASSGRHTPY